MVTTGIQRCPKVLIPQNQEIHQSHMGPIFPVTAVERAR